MLFACHMGVDLRCHNRTMTKQSLDVADINALLQQERGERMTEHVRRDMILHSGQFTVFVNNASNRLVGKWSVTPVDKKSSGLFHVLLKSLRIGVEHG